MYQMYDKAAAIREIQTYLRDAETTKVSVVPNGLYDENTRDAVLSFQLKNYIKGSGKVDFITFVEIYKDYIKRQASDKTRVIPWQNVVFPLKIGDYGEHIGLLNRLLSEVLTFYGSDHFLRDSNLFSEATELAHIAARKVFGMKDGELDRVFLNRLLTEISFIKEF